jgi:hypothetical protein
VEVIGMARQSVIAAAAVVVASAFAPATALADPVTVTGGTVVVARLGPFSSEPTAIQLVGDRGFTMTAIGAEGFFAPARDCDPVCVGGQTISLEALWGGLDLNGSATLDGVTYEHFGSGNDIASATIRLVPENFVLAADPDDSVTVTVPFRLDGIFVISPPGIATSVEQLRGRGQVTTTFARLVSADFTGYQPTRTVFAFEPAAPVPEPATLLLVGAGALWATRSQRWRSRRT